MEGKDIAIEMDKRDIAIAVLAILNVVTFAVLMYLMITRNRNTAGGQFGPGSSPSYYGYLPDELRTANAAYFTDDMADMVVRHQNELNTIAERDRRRVFPDLQPTWWDIFTGPFSEDLDQAAARQTREVRELQQKNLIARKN
ncbi:hypothetical protein ERVG_00445 [Emiliania huxleyi virus 208]|nr:hypothetical protein ERVG_00445 [Emiliania huxleyi virus 208]